MQFKKVFFFIITIGTVATSVAQNKMTPELLWQLGRVGGIGISKDGKNVLYNVTIYDTQNDSSSTKAYMIPVSGGDAVVVSNADSIIGDDKISPDGKYIISNGMVKLDKVTGSDYYPELTKSNVYIYNSLNYRHWDKWNTGKFDHVFLAPLINGKPGDKKDLMPGEEFDCPTKPMGGPNDYIWSYDGKQVVYVCKKETGTPYTISTNTDLYAYNIETGKTTDLTEGMMGYDIEPSYNKKNDLAWLSMKTPGYEADKQDIIVSNGITKINLTKGDDIIQVTGYKWSNDGNNIYGDYIVV